MKFILEYYLHFLLGLSVTAIVGLYAQFVALKLGIRTLLGIQLEKDFKYWYEKGYMPMNERRNWIKTYNIYRTLKGNGAIEDLREDLKILPIELHHTQNYDTIK